ncbi:hypothetical protein EDC01DRAFT_753365 [Geopyxis carbonaria]|nr:hypothetical protein EDC01DRAFT_753365 [Geopyxis carbonaria]
MAEISNENHARLIWVLMVVLYCVIGLRYWALRRVTYDKLSPRGISSMCILATVFMVTALASITTWNLIGPYKDVVTSGVGAIDSLDDIPEGVDIQVGTYQKDVDIEPKFETVWKVNFASMAIFYTALWLVKASFIVIYFEFSKDLSNRTRRLLYVSSVAMVVTYAFVMLVHLMWCLPMDKNWDYDILVNPGSCRAEIAPSVINSVINVLTDLLLMCAGFAIIRSLNLGRSDFRAASLIILIGCLTILVALVRLICLVVLMHQQNKILREASGDNNIVELPVQESIVGYPEIEAILAAMATCLPALRVLFRHSTGKTNASNSAPQTYESNATLTHTENYNPMLAKEIC